MPYSNQRRAVPGPARGMASSKRIGIGAPGVGYGLTETKPACLAAGGAGTTCRGSAGQPLARQRP